MVERRLNHIIKKICFYISDHGYGHASRDIAIIRHLQKNLDVEIVVKTSRPFNFVKRSLSDIKLIECHNDEGVILEDNYPKVDKIRTLPLFERWVENWENYIHKEKNFCRENNIDLIISDIAPQPFLVSKEIGIPSVAISNFSWHSVFSHIFGNNELTKRLEEAYRCATFACVLPFAEPMKVFRKRIPVSLVSRDITVSRLDFRSSLGIKEGEKLIYVGLGKSMDEKILSNLSEINDPNIRLLLPSGVRLNSGRNIRIPEEYTETQNYLEMCDLIVSKTGYSTISEGIRGNVPLFLFNREGFYEDIFLEKELIDLGIGKIISFEDFINFKWLDYLESLNELKENYGKVSKKYTEDGCEEITNIIKEILY